jgi:head-tail adaptor
MSRIYDKPVLLQRQNENTEVWEQVLSLHARVNKAVYKQGVSFSADADQYHARLLFEFRYVAALEEIRYKPQLYRLVYRGHTFRVDDYDDFLEQHKTVQIAGVLYEQ